ncbi:hypothetical protein B1987_13705 [Mycobacterium kansasii]|uniref:Helix-turn-helix domain-containing protein n=1 Tax=Mycobacterium attenuatum TaxID=2341086 RepID=A0A498QED9_9MYCO|nr:helix-turn-helix domain-containing protein [Mycobacterium attenuatum]ORB84676.1 hypothetical protein B1987_13705 [Mycobacterium kansasii]VBA43956.1 hypothetical protein LAUMK136_05362 [Mycobacterium attenuatum]
MRLSDDEAEQALYCANELIDRRRRAGVPVPAWMTRLAHRLDLTSALSSAGHENDSDNAALDANELVTTAEAAELLKVSTRQARRLSRDLDADTIGGRLVYRRSTVIEYAQERRNGRHRRGIRTTPPQPVG